MKTALLLIDIQNDYFPGGAMELVGADEAAAQAAKVLGHFRDHALPVIHIQHISARPGATFFLPDSDGTCIHRSVEPIPGEIVLQKNFPNSFRGTHLLDLLRSGGIGELAIAGMMTSMCVDATARAAFDHGFKNVLLHDAMATRNLLFKGQIVPAPQVHAAFLAALGSVYGRVSSVGEYIAAA